jgi:NAD(P)-dependent dehydrogenase (short-subunit alcohol dehydrogenase family)
MIIKEGKTYHPWRAYGRSKTANILFTYSLGKALGDKGVVAIAADPGSKSNT